MRFQAQILKAVVENQDVGSEFVDGVKAGFDAVFVDEDGDVFEVGGEHVGLVACSDGVELQVFAVGDDAGQNLHFLGEEAFAELLEEPALVAAAVSAAEDGDAASLLGECAGEDFHNRGFARAAAGEVADADHEASDCAVADDSVVVKPDPRVDRAQVEARCDEQEAFDK